MALVVDACTSSIVLTTSTRFPLLIGWLFDGPGSLAVSHILLDEIDDLDVIRSISALADDGKVLQPPKKAVDDELAEQVLEACCSNDQHVIALMRVTGARLLCTGDVRLRKDVQNRALLDNPRGKVYGTIGAKARKGVCKEPSRRTAETLLRNHGRHGALPGA